MSRAPGARHFESVVSRPTGKGTTRLVLADVNNDGALDVVTADFVAGTASLLFNPNDGTPSLAPAIIFQTGAAATSVAVADLDGDGDGDLVVAAEDFGGERVLRLKRNNLVEGVQPILTDASSLATGGSPRIVIAGDLDNDGTPDLVSLNDAAGLAGGGPATIGLHLNRTHVSPLGDLNGDGQVNAPDLALLLGNWGGPGLGDLDGSGAVGAPDLALLLGAWTG